MTPYYLAYIWNFIFLIIFAGNRSKRYIILIMIAPLVVLANLRGLVGIDTAFYLSIFSIMQAGDEVKFFFEPLFSILVYYALQLFSDPHTVLLVISSITSLLIIGSAFKLERVPILFATLIVPYFYLEYTMNAARFGLAVGVSAWAIYFLSRDKTLWFIIFAVISSQIHYASIMLTAGSWLLLHARVRTIVYVSTLSIVSYLTAAEYFSEKIAAYSDIQIDSASAGVAPLIVGIIAILALASNKEFRKNQTPQIITITILTISFFAVTQFSYAGLRLQLNIIPLIYFYAAAKAKRSKIPLGVKTIWILLLIAVISSIFRIRNYSAPPSIDILSPYAPYHFFWEAENYAI